ncbi:MAG: class I SAM-dependent methyltransferase [Patescibacteria group bacterium]
MTKTASELHEAVPPDWYFRSIRENILQRYWHRRRFTEVSKLIEPTGGKILDIGCADGMFTKVILDKSHAETIIGIDVLESSVDWANKHWKNYPEMKFRIGDAHNLDIKPETFDAVFALEVLEHVFKPIDVLREIKRVLKKGGYAIFLVPSDSLLFRVIWFFWTKFRGKIWKETHIQTYRNNYLPRLSRQTGFMVEVSKKFLLGMLHLIKVRKI